MTAGEIADKFDMSKPSISHHLNLLKQAELVWDERRGQHIVYSLNLTVFQELMKWLLAFPLPAEERTAPASKERKDPT
ncbi:transcriptional repressor SdpR-like protein [Paenibacillus mucilaginosus 3016]|uniref:Transcriptional repressor SdpR-like protein n=4 Tax=Paenibacillus mucilaginosus TaxID=61624 RepID=H6NRH7_9BACL|nr:transcriptional repressor SdpR-like protein [Paenibacillus mucilaginosus KNP414]AFC27259.1 transcriptional repressor SdpR-like protein [Paenibacillus mucilaginosus 3016]AFH59401.1 ArsR family transcriptional regulator [Paenibacillus mucilaginosus K02]